MDVFEALGLDMPDNTRSMSVNMDPADAELMAFLAPVFGWSEKEASANSLIMFPGESQQGLGDLGLFEIPSVNLGQSGSQPDGSAAAGKAEPGAKVSPFSGISQFDLFLADAPPAAHPVAPMGAPAAAPAAPAAGGAMPAPLGVTPPSEAAAPFGQQQQAAGAPGSAQAGSHQLQPELPPGLLDLLQGDDGAAPQGQQLTQQPGPQQAQPAPVSPFGRLLPPQLQQQLGLRSGAGGGQYAPLGAAGAGGPVQQQQQTLVPPPLPPLGLQQQQQPGMQQAQLHFLPLVSPLLLQPGQQQALQAVNLGLPSLPHTQQHQQHQQRSPMLHFQQQQALQQQQQQSSPDLHPDEADGEGSDGGDHKHRSGRPKRRGRPPKVPGQYSKGYEAIKRYREKKKGMVEHMEAEIAEKREQLLKLQAEQDALRSHQHALESTMSAQDQLLAQLLQLKLSVAGRAESGSIDPHLEATTAAAVAGVRAALAMQNGGDAAAEQAAAAAFGVQQRQQLQLKQQLAQKKVLEEGPIFLRRYQGYVQAVADQVQQARQQQQQQQHGAFPTFPFTLTETLSLWQLSRLAIMTRTNFANQAGSGSEEAWDDFTLNLSTGQHDLVSHDFWRGVARKVPLVGDQAVQLAAAWRLYASSMQALNAERDRLLLQLQAAAAAEEPGNAPTLVGQPAATLGQAGADAAEAGQASGGGGAAGESSSSSSSRVDRRTGTAALDVAYVYTDLLDTVERNLLRGRAVVMMFGWSMLCMLSAEQIGLVCVHSWPYFPLIRAIAGYMLGKEDLVP